MTERHVGRASLTAVPECNYFFLYSYIFPLLINLSPSDKTIHDMMAKYSRIALSLSLLFFSKSSFSFCFLQLLSNLINVDTSTLLWIRFCLGRITVTWIYGHAVQEYKSSFFGTLIGLV